MPSNPLQSYFLVIASNLNGCMHFVLKQTFKFIVLGKDDAGKDECSLVCFVPRCTVTFGVTHLIEPIVTGSAF